MALLKLKDIQMKTIIASILFFTSTVFAGGGGSGPLETVANCLNNKRDRLDIYWSESHGYYIVSNKKIDGGVFFLIASGWSNGIEGLTINFSGKDFSAAYLEKQGLTSISTNAFSDLNFHCFRFEK